MAKKISELPVATGPIDPSDLLVLVRGGVTYQIDGDAFDEVGVTSFNGREGVVTLTGSDVTTALAYSPVARNSNPYILYGTNSAGNQITVPYSNGTSLISTLLQRTSAGAAQANTPADTAVGASPNDLINRAYIGSIVSNSIVTVASDSGILDLSDITSNNVLVTLTENITSITLPAGSADLRKDLTIRFVQDATGNRTVDLTDFNWTVTVPTIGAAANQVTYIRSINCNNLGWDGV